MQAEGTVPGPHTRTPAPTARGWRTPTARPEGGQSGEGGRLTSDAPDNGERHRPRGRPSASPTASKAGPQGRTLWGWCWVPTHAPTGQEDERPGEGQRLTSDAPHNGELHPTGDILPPPPQRAMPARKGASSGAGAGSPRPHRPHPGHMGRGTPAARPRRRAAGGATAPDTRRP